MEVTIVPKGTEVQFVAGSARYALDTYPKSTENTYYIHDNGGRPFKVVLEEKEVKVYTFKDEDCDSYGDDPIFVYTPKKVFIGLSPKNEMTTFSGGYGEMFDGNTILLHIDEKTYIYIGERIFSFEAKDEITNYVSPVGGSDVPYPYAVDQAGRTYLMVESVVLENVPDNTDPYHNYYGNQTAIGDPGCCYHVEEPVEFDRIRKIWKNNKRCYLWYQPKCEDLGYDFTREKYGDKRGGKLYGQKGENDAKFEITKDMYINMMRRFAQHKNFSPLKEKEIQPRY